MEIIKISSLGCPSCIIMNDVLEQIKDIKVTNLDYDFDSEEVSKWDIGKVLPVLIFIDNDQEITRLVGEHSKEEILEYLDKLMV